MKKFLLLLLIAVCAVSCNKNESGESGDPNILFKKIYTMNYKEGDYSERVQVTAYTAIQLHGNTLSGIHFTANERYQQYEFREDEFHYEDNKLYLNEVSPNIYSGYFCTNDEKTSNFSAFEDDELIFTLTEVQ